MNKKIGPNKASPNKQFNDTSSVVQRQRLLKALRKGPISTIQARDELEILMPAARIHELRHKLGIAIGTRMRSLPTFNGKKHSVAVYFLEDAGIDGEAVCL